MQKKVIYTITFLTITIIFTLSCNNNKNPKPIPKQELDKILLEANKLQLAYDTQMVVSFIRLNKWDMKQTKTGIWYQILEHGEGPPIQEGDIVALNFRIDLLNGKKCYSSDKEGPKIFKVSRGGVESGLEEGILYLNGGDSARFIMPQYRAHHLLGDGNKIPPLTTIIYHIRIIEQATRAKIDNSREKKQ